MPKSRLSERPVGGGKRTLPEEATCGRVGIEARAKKVGAGLSELLTQLRIRNWMLYAAAFAAMTGAAAVARADPYADGVTAFMKGDYPSALRLLGPLTEQGNLSAMNIVGGMYVGGFGVEKDCAKGLALVSEAARAG